MTVRNSAGLMGWIFDNTTFMYMRIKEPYNTNSNGRLNPKTKLHKLGADYKADVIFFRLIVGAFLKLMPPFLTQSIVVVGIMNNNSNFIYIFFCETINVGFG